MRQSLVKGEADRGILLRLAIVLVVTAVVVGGWRSCASGIQAERMLVANSLIEFNLHTGGSTLPRGIGCGAIGRAGTVSAQNQPMFTDVEGKEIKKVLMLQQFAMK